MESLKVEEKDYYTCSRCNITSETEYRMCPCPRGSCEAKISGTLIITTELNTNLTLEQSTWNKENNR